VATAAAAAGRFASTLREGGRPAATWKGLGTGIRAGGWGQAYRKKEGALLVQHGFPPGRGDTGRFCRNPIRRPRGHRGPKTEGTRKFLHGQRGPWQREVKGSRRPSVLLEKGVEAPSTGARVR